MFESLTGSFSSGSLDSSGLSVALSNYDNYFKKWSVSLTISPNAAVSYLVTSSDAAKLYFTNALTGGGTYSVDFINRAILTTYESMISFVNKVPDALLNSKIALTKDYFDKLVRKNFRNKYDDVSVDTDPMTLITNLYEIQDAFCYYCLFLIFTDTQILKDDMSAYKSDKYYKQYQAMLKESMSLIAFDENEDSKISNAEKSASAGKGYLLER